jgi:hypothetical protein
MSGSRHYKIDVQRAGYCGIWTYRLPLRICTDLLGRFKSSQPLGEFAVRSACARDDRGRRYRLKKMAGNAMARGGLAQLGSSAEQRGWACGQRVWKRQPVGGLNGLGTSPCSMTRLVCKLGSGFGIAASSA